MSEIKMTERMFALHHNILKYCQSYRHEFVMPEHLLCALLDDSLFCEALNRFGDTENVKKKLKLQLDEIESVPKHIEDYDPDVSELMMELLETAFMHVTGSSAEKLDVTHMIVSLLEIEESWAGFILNKEIDGYTAEFISTVVSLYELDLYEKEKKDIEKALDSLAKSREIGEEPHSTKSENHSSGTNRKDYRQDKNSLQCLNDNPHTLKTLIGREREIERTIQILCRKEKNNPLYVGEPGVGKTAMVHGLTQRILSGDVPECLKNCRIYVFNIESILAETKFRGEMEHKIKDIMESFQNDGNAIIYIDEIHNLVGAGQIGEGSMDASNILKPYLEQGCIRFIGSTTYDEYNRYFSKSKSLVRRFLQIDIKEPSVEETIDILNGIRPEYEAFHGVKYKDEAIEAAVRQSAKYINDRFLPDKAIDIIDEAGAVAKLTDSGLSEPIVEATAINTILQKICKIDAAALKDGDNENLENLRERVLSKIYGQDEAVAQVVESVQMSKAGLSDDNKPLASLLFVGPTGVGKTEVARVLAQELGIQLIRFDMSEYTEKHAVAKLIGSPAGYVGYEDGGLLTDAIRKTPHCVLLFDEIEKAHQDIYNILLQVMDYASLTDNRGRKSDFRNVVFIMTSNAGAQHAGKRIGFEPNGSRGEAMMKQVKNIFKPEFINRLSGTVIFRDMDRHMAELIFDKKLKELEAKLAARNVTMRLTKGAREHLIQKAFTPEYGARETDRVISNTLKHILMHEILFGKLKSGGNITITLQEIKDCLVNK